MSMQKPVPQHNARPVLAVPDAGDTAQDPSALYFSAPSKPAAPVDLRSLSAMEQMFSYFGADRA